MRRRRAPDMGTSRFARQRQAGRRWSVAGVVAGLLVGTALAAPASWLADALGEASGGRLQLAEARGTVWNGSAVAVLTGGSGSRDAAALPGRLHWTLRPGWRGLRIGMRQDCCIPDLLTLQLSPAWSGYTLTVGAADPAAVPAPGAPGAPEAPREWGHWPAAWLAGLGAPFNTLALGGTLRLASPGLVVQSVQGRLRLEGRLDAELLDVRSRLSPLPVLGSYRLALQGTPGGGETALVTLATLGGALQMNGQGQWSGGRLRFRGEARAAPGQDAALANLLSLIGRRQGAVSSLLIG